MLEDEVEAEAPPTGVDDEVEAEAPPASVDDEVEAEAPPTSVEEEVEDCRDAPLDGEAPELEPELADAGTTGVEEELGEPGGADVPLPYPDEDSPEPDPPDVSEEDDVVGCGPEPGPLETGGDVTPVDSGPPTVDKVGEMIEAVEGPEVLGPARGLSPVGGRTPLEMAEREEEASGPDGEAVIVLKEVEVMVTGHSVVEATVTTVVSGQSLTPGPQLQIVVWLVL